MSIREIEAYIAGHYGLSLEEIRGPRRRRRFTEARQLVMYSLRIILGMSFPEIGAVMGRDHTTIMYACQRLALRMSHKQLEVWRMLKAPERSPAAGWGTCF